jgi:hypothetical protein
MLLLVLSFLWVSAAEVTANNFVEVGDCSIDREIVCTYVVGGGLILWSSLSHDHEHPGFRSLRCIRILEIPSNDVVTYMYAFWGMPVNGKLSL